MQNALRSVARKIRSAWRMRSALRDYIEYPKHRWAHARAARKRRALRRISPANYATNRRALCYDSTLIPNRYVASIDAGMPDNAAAIQRTGLTMGYPAWNLLYYTLLCSLPPDRDDIVIVETGTNLGFSTILLAQALKDSGSRGVVHTVDIDPAAVDAARRNVACAGLSELVQFHVQDAIGFLTSFVDRVQHIDFAFLDDLHENEHVRKEFALIYPRVVAGGGKVYFDNTLDEGVAEALPYIRRAYGGNMIEFRNCSWSPPGNVIWQAAW